MSEYYKLAWTKNDAKRRAPNVVKIIQRHMTLLVITTIPW